MAISDKPFALVRLDVSSKLYDEGGFVCALRTRQKRGQGADCFYQSHLSKKGRLVALLHNGYMAGDIAGIYTPNMELPANLLARCVHSMCNPSSHS